MKCADNCTIEKIGIPSMVLMERAALCVVEAMERECLNFTKVLVICGSGNNGGDGYAVARLLALKGYAVKILFVGKDASRSEENRKQKEIAAYYNIPMYADTEFDADSEGNAAYQCIAQAYTLIIDAMFGTGLSREVSGKYAEVLTWANQQPATRVAIDIPSGIHDTTGEVMGTAFRADYTVAIAFVKRGLVLYPAVEYVGKISVGEIGITEDTLPRDTQLTYHYEWEDLVNKYPVRKSNSHKGSHGKVLLIVGSKGMSGAAYLSARAAYEVGAGLVQIYTEESNREILQKLLPEAIITTYTEYDGDSLERLLKWADVVGIGSGLGTSETAVKLVEDTMKCFDGTCVVDADAINILAERKEWLNTNTNARFILTPHMKEMSRLTGNAVSELQKSRVELLNAWTEQYPVVCVMKDARTLVAKQGEDLYVNLSGNAAMAKAGSGDVLMGMISGIAAQKKESYEAACLGVYLHGLAGDVARDEKGSYSVLADDIIDGISSVLKKL